MCIRDSVESAHKSEEAVETGAYLVREGYRSHKLKPYRKAAQAERQLEKANVNVLYQKSLQENPQFSSNPLSRWQQKQAIKKQYAAAKRTGQTAGNTAQAASKTCLLYTSGHLIEDFFPRTGVRYIAMNDGIDTLRDNNDIAPFKNILNEMYSKDISKKVHSSYLLKAQKGQFTGCLAPFGYRKDPEDKNHLLDVYKRQVQRPQRRMGNPIRNHNGAKTMLFCKILRLQG